MKKPVKPVKPIKAWALLLDGKISWNRIYKIKDAAMQNLQYWGPDYTGPIRVEIRPVQSKRKP